MCCLSLRLLSNCTMFSHFVQAVWEKFDRSVSGSIRLIQRKLIQINSNLRRHCSIREILWSKYTFRWRVCQMSRRQSIASRWGGTWDNRRLWQGADDGCAAAAGASPSGSTQRWCAGGDPIGNHVFSYPWEDHSHHVWSSVISICLRFPHMLLYFTELWELD